MARKDRKDRGLLERPKGSDRWWVRYYADGRAVLKFIGTKTQARNYYDTIKTKQRAGEPVVEPMRTTIGRLVELGVADAKAQGHRSMLAVTRFAALLNEQWGPKRAATLTTSDVLQYRALRRAGTLTTKDTDKPHHNNRTWVGDSTINRELKWLRHCYRLGLDHEPPLVARIPRIPLVQERNKRTGFFEPVEFTRLRAHLPEHVKVVAVIGYHTGMRIGEILGLRWTQIDFAEGVLRLDPHATKTDEAREIPLVGEVQTTLEAWRLTTMTTYSACPFVCHYRGERLERITTAWKRATAKAGLPGKLFHDFRRTAVRNLVRAGVDPTIAKRISGHKTDSIFSRYNIVNTADLVQAGRLLERYLEAATATQSTPGTAT